MSTMNINKAANIIDVVNDNAKLIKIMNDNSIMFENGVANLPFYIGKFEISKIPEMKTMPYLVDGLMLIYVLEGNLGISVRGKNSTLEAGEICIISSHCLHYMYSIDGKNCTFYAAVIKEKAFSLPNDIENKYISPLFKSLYPDVLVVRGDAKERDRLIVLFRNIIDLDMKKPTAYELLIMAKIYECVAYLHECFEEKIVLNNEATISKDKVIDKMDKMLEYIKQNYDKIIGIDDICKAGGVSRTKCFRLFKKYTQDTPLNYLLKMRLFYAKNYLADSDISIAEIASLCGFAHQSHLTNHFSRMYGITPLKYRKQSTNY